LRFALSLDKPAADDTQRRLLSIIRITPPGSSAMVRLFIYRPTAVCTRNALRSSARDVSTFPSLLGTPAFSHWTQMGHEGESLAGDFDVSSRDVSGTQRFRGIPPSGSPSVKSLRFLHCRGRGSLDQAAGFRIPKFSVSVCSRCTPRKP